MGKGMGSTRANGTVYQFGFYEESERAIRQNLDESTLNGALEEGRKMTLYEAVEFASRDN